MFDEDQVAGQHRQIETIKRAVKGQSERGLYLRGLRACRTAAMLNQRELAARAHTYQSTINALERQIRAASLAMVRRLCEALDVAGDAVAREGSPNRRVSARGARHRERWL